MPEIKIASLSKFFVVLLLEDKPISGYDIMKELEQKIGVPPSPGQVYPFLKELKDHKYVKLSSSGPRDKQVYLLTDEGKKFAERLSSRFDSIIELAIKPKLDKCAECRCEIYKGGVRVKINGKALDFCCNSCAEHYAGKFLKHP